MPRVLEILRLNTLAKATFGLTAKSKELPAKKWVATAVK
jgi:hypothetical protein